MSTSLVVAIVLTVVGAGVSLALLIARGHGRSRVLGVIGVTLILLGVLARFAFQWMVEQLLGQVDVDTIIPAMVWATVLGGVLTGVGLLLATGAVVLAQRDRP